MRFMVYGVKDGETVESLKASAVSAVAKARLLVAEGWAVHIMDERRKTFVPSMFDDLLGTVHDEWERPDDRGLGS